MSPLRKDLRIPVSDRPGVLADITRIIADNNISIESVIQKEALDKEVGTEVIMMTHTTVENSVQRAIRMMQELKSVRGQIILLRQEELR